MNLLTLLNLFYRAYYHIDEDVWDEYRLDNVREGVIGLGKAFLQWLIDNDHIELIGEGTINDYIRYIATTDDPIQTLSDLIK